MALVATVGPRGSLLAASSGLPAQASGAMSRPSGTGLKDGGAQAPPSCPPGLGGYWVLNFMQGFSGVKLVGTEF